MENNDIQIDIKTDKKAYFKCSMYYMRRYFGLREVILIAVLFVLGVLLYALSDMILILALFGITMALLLLTFGLFVWTSVSGYKIEIERKNIKSIRLIFGENELISLSANDEGEPIFKEEFKYEKIEKVVLRPKFIYIYAAVSVFFYIYLDEIGMQNDVRLREFLHEKLSADKFKFKRSNRMFPKRKKVEFK